MSAFSDCLKRFFYCLLRHNSTIQYQVHFEILCLLKRAGIGVFSKGTSFFIRFIRYYVYDLFVHGPMTNSMT